MDKEEVAWEVWQKRRVFVRELAGKYGEVYKTLLEQPRVYSSRDIPFKGKKSRFGKIMVAPHPTLITQLIEIHMDVIPPQSHGQKHGHMNSAVFFILEGEGYDIHDGKTIEWKAGDACIVENACVHQHFAEGDKPVRIIIIKAKPAFIFSHLLFQKIVEYPPDHPPPGYEDYQPENWRD